MVINNACQNWRNYLDNGTDSDIFIFLLFLSFPLYFSLSLSLCSVVKLWFDTSAYDVNHLAYQSIPHKTNKIPI